MNLYVSFNFLLHSFEWKRIPGLTGCLGGLQNQINKLTKKAAAAIPTPAARTEVMLEGFSALD